MNATRVLMACTALALCAVSAQPQALIIRGARIVPVESPVIERGAILIEAGKIRAMGVTVNAPAGARIIDAVGKTIMPGIVDANARFGVDGGGNEEGSETTPEFRVVDVFDPRSLEVQRALQGGVTSACLTPGSRNSVGGLCTVVKTVGGVRCAVVRESVALKVALGSDVFAGNGGFRAPGGENLVGITTRRPNSRMGAVWELRRALFSAPRRPVLARVANGSLPIRIHARIENDLRAAMNVADEFRLTRVVLDDAVEAYKVADQIAAHKYSVVLGPVGDAQAVQAEGSEVCLRTACLLAERRVPFAFGSNAGEPDRLLTWAALAAHSGLPRDLALRAVTLAAAEIAGVADRVGSLRPGKDADILILDGDPLEWTTRIETVIVNGQVVYASK